MSLQPSTSVNNPFTQPTEIPVNDDSSQTTGNSQNSQNSHHSHHSQHSHHSRRSHHSQQGEDPSAPPYASRPPENAYGQPPPPSYPFPYSMYPQPPYQLQSVPMHAYQHQVPMYGYPIPAPQFVTPSRPAPPPPLAPPRPYRPAPPPPPPHQQQPSPHNEQLPADPYSSVSQHVGGIGPVPRVYPITMKSWADADSLALERENWLPWSARARGELGMIPGAWRFIEWEEGEEPNLCPSSQAFPAHYRAWIDQDRVIRSFLIMACAVTERLYLAHCKTAAQVWEALRARHEFRGPAGQIAALKKFASIQYGSDPSTFEATTTLLKQVNDAIWLCGPPDPSAFLLSGIISALAPKHLAFSDTILGTHGITLADALERLSVKQSQHIASMANSAEAHILSSGDFCSNSGCPKPNTHTLPYCTSKGGGCEGKTIAEANDKYRADRNKKVTSKGKERTTGGASGGVAQKKSPHVKYNSSGRAYITSHGTDFFITPTEPPAAAPTPVANTTLLTDPLPTADPEAWLCGVDPRVSLDWGEWMAASATTTDYELIADTGANVHISPDRSDFVTFTEIAPRPIKGFQGSAINATGIGTVVNEGFTQHNVLYVPNAAVRLLSVVRLCQAEKLTFHFDETAAWITDRNKTIICTGAVHPTRQLYVLHSRPLIPSANLGTASTRDLRHWHLCLGHANHQSVADLYSEDLADGTRHHP